MCGDVDDWLEEFGRGRASANGACGGEGGSDGGGGGQGGGDRRVGVVDFGIHWVLDADCEWCWGWGCHCGVVWLLCERF